MPRTTRSGKPSEAATSRQVSRLLYRANAYRASAPLGEMVKKTSTRVSVQRVDFQSAAATKSHGAWRYKDGIIERHESTRINGRNYFDPKPGLNGERTLPRRKNESNFLLTINPNLAPRDGADVQAVGAALKTVMSEMGGEAGVRFMLKFGPKDDVFKSDRYEDVVLGYDWKAGVEMGPRAGRVHAHAWLTIRHISQVQLDVKKIQDMTRQRYNALYSGTKQYKITRMPYVHIKLLPQAQWTEIVKSYLHKGSGSVEL